MPSGGTEGAWRTVHAVWVGCAALAAAVWVVLPVLVRVTPRADAVGQLLTLIFLGVGALEVAIGVWFKRRALHPGPVAATAREALGRLVGQSLVAVVMTQTPAVLGIVAYIVTGSRVALSLLCGMSVLGLFLVRPRLEEWQETLLTLRIDEDRRPRG
ncbi:MAG: hypothetical protein QN174_05860 [Armatimonadota bacterium]|nr:hypothetical protein [Armatimonadota bacterium]MDR7496465.1 hypothetical protein [Armatimonadota bacterium]